MKTMSGEIKLSRLLKELELEIGILDSKVRDEIKSILEKNNNDLADSICEISELSYFVDENINNVVYSFLEKLNNNQL